MGIEKHRKACICNMEVFSFSSTVLLRRVGKGGMMMSSILKKESMKPMVEKLYATITLEHFKFCG